MFCILAYVYAQIEGGWFERQQARETAEGVAKRIEQRQSLAADLSANRVAVVGKIKELQAGGKLTEARAEAWKYSLAGDAEITQLIAELDAQMKVAAKKVKIAELEGIVKGTKESDTQTKRNRYEELVALDPDNKEYKQKFAYYQKQLAADEEKMIRAAKAQKRKEGVRIGMSKQDVLDSSWGRPEHVNASTYAWGTREQWVYGGSNYLYFEGDTLTSVQTGR